MRGQLRYGSNRPTGARVPKPSVLKLAVKPPTSIFEGLPKGSIGKHLGQFKKTLDALKGATGGRF
jgi:hypothetical protein